MDPLKRVKMFQHMGARQVGTPPIPHFQPPLGNLNTNPNRNLNPNPNPKL